jgi:predicted MFS family arabinose efflux permease
MVANLTRIIANSRPLAFDSRQFALTNGVSIKRSDFTILCLQGFCIAFNVASVSAIVPAMASDFGVSDFAVGRINWAYMLPYGLMALLYGPLTRRFENRFIAIASLVCFSVFSFLSGVAGNVSSLFFYRFMVGVFAAAITPLSLIYIADHAPQTGRGKAVGLFFSATFVADLSGLALSGVVPWRVMFFIPAVLGMVAAYFTARHFPATLAGRDQGGMRYLEAFKDHTVLRAFGYIFLISLFYHGVRQWLGVYLAQELGLRQFLVSMVLTMAALAGIFGEAIGGFLADRQGRVPTLKIGLFLMVLSLALLIFFKAVAALFVILLVWGFGWTMNHAGMSTYLTDLNKRFMKEISSLNSSVRFVAGGLGVIVGGWVMQRGFVLGFLLFGAVLFGLFLQTDRILISNGRLTSNVKLKAQS